MNPFNPQRRDLLRVGSLGVAGAAIPAISFAATSSPADSNPGAAPGNGVFFNVHAYGATGDGKTVDSPAINRAIDAAAAAGGGMVLFPAGIYLCFSIRLKSNVHLHLEQGATILAADSPKPGETTGYNGGTYDAAEPNDPWEPYQDYGHNHWHNSLIWGEDLHDISITGTGLIYGKGLSFGAGPGRAASTEVRGFFTEPAGRPAANSQSTPAVPGTPPAQPERHFNPRGDYPMFQAEQPGVGNKAIALKNCHNVVLRDFSILKGGHFGLLLTGVDNLTIDNLTIDTDRDGIDIDCCQNVRVSNCTVNSPWDDGICPKSSYALGYARATRNVTIANCFVTGCYQLGTVLDGTWKKFPKAVVPTAPAASSAAPNRTAASSTSPSQIASSKAAWATLWKPSTARCLKTSPSPTPPCATSSPGRSSCASARACAGPKKPPRSARSSASSSTISTATTRPCASAPSSAEFPRHAIEDVKLSNIYVETVGGATPDAAQLQPPEKEDAYPEPSMFGQMPSSGFFLRHIRNLEMSHVEIANATPDARPAFYLQDVNRADFFSITAPRTSDGAFALHDVKDLRIGWSRAAATSPSPPPTTKRSDAHRSSFTRFGVPHPRHVLVLVARVGSPGVRVSRFWGLTYHRTLFSTNDCPLSTALCSLFPIPCSLPLWLASHSHESKNRTIVY